MCACMHACTCTDRLRCLCACVLVCLLLCLCVFLHCFISLNRLYSLHELLHWILYFYFLLSNKATFKLFADILTFGHVTPPSIGNSPLWPHLADHMQSLA